MFFNKIIGQGVINLFKCRYIETKKINFIRQFIMGKKNKNFSQSQFDEPIIEKKKKFQKPMKDEKSFEEEFFSEQEIKKNKAKNKWEQKKAFKKKDRYDDYYDDFN